MTISLLNADQLEHSIAQLKQELKVLGRRSPTSDLHTRQEQRDEINRQLAVAQLALANIRANARYLFLLACAAAVIIAVVWCLLDLPSPIQWAANQVDAHNHILYRTSVVDENHSIRGMSGLPLRDPLGH